MKELQELVEELAEKIEKVIDKNTVDLRNVEDADKNADKNLNELKLRTVTNLVEHPIVIIDEAGVITFWNKAAYRVFGYAKKEVLNRRFDAMLAPLASNYLLQMKLTCLKNTGEWTKGSLTFAVTALSKENKRIEAEVTSAPFQGMNGTNVVLCIKQFVKSNDAEDETLDLFGDVPLDRDLREIEQSAKELISINRQLNESETKLKQLNLNKDKLFAIISHDIKNPFQALINMSEILNDDINNLPREDISELAYRINNSANHVYKLVENLLQWAKMEAGFTKFQPEICSLAELIIEIKQIFEQSAVNKNISITTKVDYSLQVYADVDMLKSIIRNLVSNAIKYTSSGGEVEIRAEEIEGFVEIKIIDNGVGISDENMEKLFDLESVISTEGTNHEKGTGLGFIITREFVEKHGGKICAVSEPGEGSTFTFTIPHNISGA